MKTVLVVDDEFDLTSTLRAVLRNAGYRVETCTEGAQVMGRLSAARPDLLLMDVMMPEVDGLHLLRRLRSVPDLKEMPVVLMSVLPPTVKREDYGWQAFLRKPFTLETVIRTVEQLVGKACAVAGQE